MVNITFFLQIIHFFLAWYMLTALVLKPCLVLLQHIQQRQDTLHQEQAEVKHELEDARMQEQATWRDLRHFVRAEIVDSQQDVGGVDAVQERRGDRHGQEKISVGDRKALINQMAQVLVAEARDV